MIRVLSVTKRFDNVLAVNHLSTTFSPGITGLVGQNGAGKSTLFRIIAGIYHADEGTAYVDNDPSDSKEGKSRVFFLSDDPYAPRGANIQDTLDFYLGLFDIDVDEFNRLIGTFGLPRTKAVSTFSKGMKRQMFVALTLSAKADHLLLDEAFDGLDPLAVDTIKNELIDSSTKGKTIVISSHNIFALQKLVDRFVIISGGEIAREQTNEDMGSEFVKFQAAFSEPITQETLEGLGFEVISFRNVGSVSHFVLLGGKSAGDVIRDTLHPVFIDSVPLEPEEIVSLEMLLAKKGGTDNA